jgi:hypothetical protein
VDQEYLVRTAVESELHSGYLPGHRGASDSSGLGGHLGIQSKESS